MEQKRRKKRFQKRENKTAPLRFMLVALLAIATSSLVISLLPGYLQIGSATSGGGTNVVSPTAAGPGSTGNTFTFTYTADTTKDSGQMAMTFPTGSDWSGPTLSSGSAGYTTVSSTGMTADVINSLNSAAETDAWVGKKMERSTDLADYPETFGSSINNKIGANAKANEMWYMTTGTNDKNWGGRNATGNLKVGYFIKSNVALDAGDFHFMLDDSLSMASPLDTISMPAVSADTWTYNSITLGAATRTTVNTWGYRYSVDKGALDFRTAALASLFDDADATTNWAGSTSNVTVSALGSSKEGTNAIRCTFATGAGTNEKCRRSSNTTVTLGPVNTVSFWVRSSIDTGSSDLQWMNDNSTALGSPEDTVSLPALAANTWTYVSLAAPNSTTLSARSWGINQVNDLGAFTLDIDAMGKIIPTGNFLNWTLPSSDITLTNDTSQKKEGTASLKAAIAASAPAGDIWIQTFAIDQDWANYSKVGFWIRSTVNTNVGDLQFAYDGTAGFTSPIATLDVGALTANTWSWQKLTLTGTRNIVKSYGIKYATDIGAADVNVDYIVIGPGLPIISSSTLTVNLLSLASTETITVTYGAGGGASGANASWTEGNHTFTTRDMDSSDGTLTTIASSPVILVNSQPSGSTPTADPSTVNIGDEITFSQTWTDTNAGETVKFFVCRTNALTSSATGGCAGGAFYESGSYTSSSPQTGTYVFQQSDVTGAQYLYYYAFVCDSKQVSNSCSSSRSAYLTVNGYLTVGTSGTQVETLAIPSTAQFIGGAFTVIHSNRSPAITQIIVSEKGTVNANANLSNLKLYYQFEETCSATFPVYYYTFNSSAATFNASDQAVVTGNLFTQTSNICIYAKLNVGSGASNAETIELEISNPSSDLTVSAGTVIPASSIELSGTTTLVGGSLSVDIVDASGVTVGSPSISFSSKTFSYSSQTSTGTLGTSSQRIRVDNGTATATWTLSIAATSGATALWDGGTPKYDFNDASGASDGSDADSYGGQLTINPATGSIAAVSPCASTTGLNKGSSNSYQETSPAVSSITLLSADGTASTSCAWDFTGISLSQTIPGSQTIGTYTISFTITVA